MQLPVSLWIGLRYSQSRKGNAIISFMTLFSIAGIFLGVMALTLVSSVMNGFEAELKKRILGVLPHLIVQPVAQTPVNWQSELSERYPGIVQISPFIQAEALVQSPRQLMPVQLQGVDVEQLPDFMAQSLVRGQWQQLAQQRFPIVLGRELAEELEVGLGDSLRLSLAQGGSYTPLGWMPRQRLFQVVGLLETGSELDQVLAVVKLEELQRLVQQPGSGSAEAVQWRIQLQDPFVAPALGERLVRAGYFPAVQDWRQSHGKLFAAVAMEKAMMWLLLLLIVAVAAFNIVSALVMMVTEKQAEVAILKTQGMQNHQLFTIFAVQGMSNGMIGAVLGAIAGVLLSGSVNTLLAIVGLQIAGGVELPVLMKGSQILMIVCSALLLTFLAVLYPAWRAVQIQPAEVLRDE
ncbi:lipoprotein-releasing ABC transporter permease subunit [Alkalimonas sp. MEB108]|uniref:Lipoprotein-releasing ABC transporter permease subunit n=1 Tax=Alkalimonas cellulosilytica TaxID=3058395 RepID=A0ABU7J4N2_9GAMM|nr:lipoprotein-releasing ABC transporter permease subunit [Alkalimonas sp. MEB108]MEE2001468.1 lipoprotein-releasing ABC transporter permease subunit [Alkalimonas sp. MEB108]